MTANAISGSIFILLICLSFTNSYKTDHGFGYRFKHDPNAKQRETAEKLTNDYIRNALGGGLGNQTIFSEPFTVNDLATKFSGTTMSFSDIRVYGLDRFRPLELRSDFTNLVISLTLLFDQVNVLGDFRMTPWIANAEGTFNYTIMEAWLTFEANIVLTNEGSEDEGLALGDVLKTDLTYEGLQLDFDNIGFLNTVLKPVKNSLAKYIFSQMKPILCKEGEQNFKRLVNKVMEVLPKESPKAVNNVDRALIRARQSMKIAQLDPLEITDHYPKSTKLVKLELTDGKLFGLSSMKRIGPIYVGFERDAIHMTLTFGVENLRGQYTWKWILWKHLLTNRGTIRFNVDDIIIKAALTKRLNAQDNLTRVENITMNIGSVNLVSDGIGAVKYIMETFLNVIPDAFRQRIKESAEYRLLTVIEDEVGKIDLEELVEDDAENSLETATA